MFSTTFQKTLIVACFWGLIQPVFAQNQKNIKNNYALLWEISGKNLTKPSYLFGTMHLRDKRVFEFSDSVLVALDACDAFASEIRLDSAVYGSWQIALAGDTTNRLRSQLSQKGYERLLKSLKSKGINFDSLQSKNEVLIKNWLSDFKETDKKGSKDLFLDLYLTRLAYWQGKPLYGLERLEDYEDLNQSFFQQFEDSTFLQKEANLKNLFAQFTLMERMINTYSEGNLSAIEKIVKSEQLYSNGQHKRDMLDNRNVRMLQRLEEMIQAQSVFCAVGAAHLVDSMGLIQLLRQKGYTVRKVTPQFTGMAQQYKEKKVDRPWQNIKDEFNHFEIAFPDAPYSMNKLNTNRKILGNQYIYFDITNGALYIAESEYHPYMGRKKITKEQLLNEAFNSWVKARDFKHVQKEKISLGEHEGYAFTTHTQSDALAKGQFFLANNNIYKTLVFFDKHNNEPTERSEKFQKSLKINPLPLTDWQAFDNEKGAFSIQMPSKTEEQELKNTVTDEEGRALDTYAYIFMSKDAKDGFTYLLRYNDMPTGRFIDNDSTYLSLLIENSLNGFKKVSAEVEVDSTTRHYGCPEANMKVSNDGINLFLRILLRGNRTYLLMGQPPMAKNKANDKKLEDWLNSFRFLPFSTPQLTSRDFPELGLKVGLPNSKERVKPLQEAGSFPAKTETNVQATDDNSGGIYIASKTVFSPYYSVESEKIFWENYVKKLIFKDTSTFAFSIKDTTFRGFKAKLAELNYQKSQNAVRTLTILKDGYLYDFTLTAPREILTDAYANHFYNTIELTSNKETRDIYTSRKQLIINDLSSSTDSVRQEAKTALIESDWQKEDVSLLSQALIKNYPDDTLTYDNTRSTLLRTVTQFKDATTLSVLEKLINGAQTDTLLRNEVLCAFLDLDTLNSTDRFFTVARSLPTIDDNALYCLRRFMVDSLERAKLYYDKMLTLSPKPLENRVIVGIIAGLAQNDTLKIMSDIFEKQTPQYLAAVQSVVGRKSDMIKSDTLSETEWRDFYMITNYIDLFGHVPYTPDINRFLRTMIANTNQAEILSSIALTLARNRQPIENTHWQKLLKNKMIWYELLLDLDNTQQLKIVPPQYLNQKDIAEGFIRSYLMEDYGAPKNMSLLDTQKYKGENLYVYNCEMDFGNDEKTYIIALCSQPSDKSKFKLEPTVFTLSEDLTEVKNYKKIVENLLKDYEKAAH